MGTTMEGARPAVVVGANGRRTLYVTYKGDVRWVDGQAQETFALAEVFGQALGAGDTVQFLQNKYWPPLDTDGCGGQADAQPIRLEGLTAPADRPITIRGLGAETILCGANAAVPIYPALPQASDYAFFQLIGCEGVVIEHFQVECCWPCFVYMEDCRYVSIRAIAAVDSQYLIFARGESTRNVLVEGCDWQQDPSGAVWDSILWEDSHHGLYDYLNGALFGSELIGGGVVFRSNRIHNSYNGIRIKARGEDVVDRLNLDIEVSHNQFERVRDNAVEPEGTATNLSIHHNTICNVHAWFSFDGVAGGYWAVFANRGWFDDKPGLPFDENNGGRVIKLDNEEPYPSHPVEVFNNSWYLRVDVMKAGRTRMFQHRNNAVQFCDVCDHPDGICNDPNRAIVGPKFMSGGWDPTVGFDFDQDNRPFPAVLTANGQEPNGIYRQDFRFADGANGDFWIKKPETGAWIALEGWPVPRGWQPEEFQIGCLQGYGPQREPLDGPPFACWSPDAEMPRISRVDRRHHGRNKGRIFVWFTRPMADGAFPVTLRTADGQRIETEAFVKGYRLKVRSPVPPFGVTVTLSPEIRGADGLPVTLWAGPADARVELSGDAASA